MSAPLPLPGMESTVSDSSIGHRDEKPLNLVLSTALKAFLPGGDVRAERTQRLADGGQPDLEVNIPGRERVLIENKYDSTANEVDLKKQCLKRLNTAWDDTGSPVRIAVGVLSPREQLDRFDDTSLEKALRMGTVVLRWSVWIGHGARSVRLPKLGWLNGSVRELAACIDRVGAEAGAEAHHAEQLQKVLTRAAGIVGTPDGFGEILMQESGVQTSRMAAAVLFNACLCQATLAAHYDTIPSPTQMMSEGAVHQHTVLKAWQDILDINYWPIFGVARHLLQKLPDMAAADQLLELLFEAVGRMIRNPHATSLAGRIFGSLIADQKFLATFYTMPSPAALLAELAMVRLPAIDWGDATSIGQLRIADFACGTGSLLVAVYRRLAERHALAGGDVRALHRTLIEDVLIGCDVMPAAVHLTAARLSGEQPDIDYTGTKTFVMPYGEVDMGGSSSIRLGSLDLLHQDQQPALFGDGTIAATATGEDVHALVDVPAGSLDLVIMNPPFTRSTGQEGGTVGVPRATWAGFGQTEAQQKACEREWKRQVRRIRDPKASNGQAGMATYFIDLAHAKLRNGGVLALIVPATMVSGQAWEGTRALLEQGYRDICICTLAAGDEASGKDSPAFSADTGMAEAVVLATRDASDCLQTTARHFILDHRPQFEFAAVEIARAMAYSGDEHIRLGHENVGRVSDVPFAAVATGHPSGVHFPGVVRTATVLSEGRLALTRMKPEFDLPVTRLANLGLRGPYHMDLNGMDRNKPRGPFDIHNLPARSNYVVSDYPCLWAHDHAVETCIRVLPDTEGEVRSGMEDKALDRWAGYRFRNGERIAGATRLHINRDFRVNSQALGACLTPEKALGGRAWPSFQPMPEGTDDPFAWEAALAVWLNTTLGLAGRWWVSNRPQRGRVTLSITKLGVIPVLDLRNVEVDTVRALADLCVDWLDTDLRPANEAYRDKARRKLDAEVLCEVLGLPNTILGHLDHFRLQWCSEPSVHDGKDTQPA